MNSVDQYLHRLAESQSVFRPGPADAARTGPFPWVVPPAGSQPFDVQGSQALPTAGDPAVVLVTFTVDPGWDGVIKRLSCNYAGAGFQQGSGDLVWRIFIDGAAVKGYDNIVTELGSVERARETDGILIYSGQLVQLVGQNVAVGAAGAYLLGSLAGYTWQR